MPARDAGPEARLRDLEERVRRLQLENERLAKADELAERRRTEGALRVSEERLRLAFEAAEMGVLDWDVRTGDMRWLAKGLGEGPWVSSLDDWLALVHPDDRARVRAAFEDAARDAAPGRGRPIEHRLDSPGGDVRRIELRLRALDAPGERRVLGVALDVTARRRLEEDLVQAQKMESVGRLAGGIAHDFNNLLTTILGLGESLAGELPPGDPMRADLEAIGEAARHAAGLTRQLLAFSRKQRLEARPLRLDECCRDFAGVLERTIGEDVRLAWRLGPVPPVLADRAQIQQVLVNLVVNARDAMPGGGEVAIETAEADGATDGIAAGRWVRVRVSDTGTGMSPEIARRAFEPFFTTKDTGKGTGLGLATVYGIVKQHAGHTAIRSERGRGTSVSVYLRPAPKLAPDPPVKAPAATVRLAGTETVLVVDDEPGVRHVVRSALSRLGYTVLEAPSGADALELLGRAARAVDLLLTDVAMPGMGGRELARRFREACPAVRVVYMSGYAGDPDALGEGAIYVQKPATAAELAARVRDALDAPRA